MPHPDSLKKVDCSIHLKVSIYWMARRTFVRNISFNLTVPILCVKIYSVYFSLDTGSKNETDEISTSAPPKIILPASAPVIRVLPGFRMTWSATGSPPIYTALIRNATLLANTSGSMTVQLHEEGNFTCVATSEYGTDVKQFSVVLSG